MDGKETKLRVLSSNKDGSAVSDELGLKDIQIKPPVNLDAEAASLWKSLIPEIKKLGYLKKVDQPALELYCKYYSMYRASEDLIEKHGLWIYDKNDVPVKRSPAAVQLDACVKNLKALGHDLGLTFDSGMRQITIAEPKGQPKPAKTPLQEVKFGADV